MKNTRKSIDIKRLTYIAAFTAIVVVLQFIPIRIGTFELALSVPAIVIGAALCGVGTGAWLGFVFGAVVLMLPGTAAYLSFHALGTVLTVLVKGILAGLAAGAVYKLLDRINRYAAVFASAVVATLVNTSVFLVGSMLFFESDISTVINVLISINFLIELAVNVVLVPTIYRVINIKKKA